MTHARAASRKLDSFDRAILRIVQRDNKMPQRSIAEAVNLSAAAVQRRIAAMHELWSLDAAQALFRAAPEVQQCYYVTGGTSFMLIIVSPDMVSYEATTRRLFAQNDAVASFRTLVALDRVKTGSEIVVP